MFLTESVETNVPASVTLQEAVMEANEVYHELCMKMVKCEHTAIVSEDSNLLAEAEEKFFDKVKRIAKTLYEKFIAFINRIKAEWSKLVAFIASKFVNEKDVKAMMKKVQGSNIKVKANLNSIQRVQQVYENVVALKGDGDLKGNKKKIEAELKSLDAKKDAKTVTTGDVTIALNFLKKRPDWIKKLEKLRSEARKAYEKSLKDDAKADELLIAQYSSIVNKVISRVNYVTIDAVKICRAAKSADNYSEGKAKKATSSSSSSSTTSNSAADYPSEFDYVGGANARAKSTAQLHDDYSILDMF